MIFWSGNRVALPLGNNQILDDWSWVANHRILGIGNQVNDVFFAQFLTVDSCFAGRVSFFTSGSENLHHVEKVHWGTRYAITISFTCNPDHGIRDPVLTWQMVARWIGKRNSVWERKGKLLNYHKNSTEFYLK